MLVGQDNGIYHDPAEDHRASFSKHPVESMEPDSDYSKAVEMFMDLLDRLVVEILSTSKNGERDLKIFLLCTRIGLRDNVCAADVARHYGITRAAVSKIQTHMVAKLNLPPSIIMRKISSKPNYVSSNKRPLRNACKP